MKERAKGRVKCYWGFPLESSSQGPRRGISLLIAMMTVAMMIGLVADLIISSSVNIELGISSRDKIKAEYLAKSGQNLGIFLLSASWGIDLFRASPMAGPAKADPNDSDASIWNSLNDLPPMGASSVKLLKAATDGEEDPFNLKGIFSEEIAAQMAQFEDSFAVKIYDESSRINLSMCKKETTCPIEQLMALFSCPAEKAFLEKRDVSPEELAYRIYDFIGEGDRVSDQSGFTDKDDPYLKHVPPYKARRLPLDAVTDLRLIEGWDDDIHAVFSRYITVYPFYDSWTSRKAPPININTAPVELLRCLVPDTRSAESSEKFMQMITKMKKDATPIVQNTKDIGKTLKEKFFYESSGGERSANRVEWFTNRSDVFRVKVEAETGNQTITAESVVRRINPKEVAFLRNQQQVKRSYQILYNRFQ